MQYQAGGTIITCPCCKHTHFDKDYRQLNTRGATFFGLDWTNKEATILICNKCSYILWFMQEPTS
ncbi:hypothetical protein BRE01_50740 [Brevibacillus reuszeri]|uniref:DNA-binding protein n=1 Tax=Brevibacillus reuszeri TaxID=54915 RepID=A0A0K9YLT2_9BACL|nr:hypothetical protein ADS79_27770 [Brevibacillus reuszeri]GED71372.1 hypothetical protein BRE01_50740 [Brevibacillus reuszeri]